MNQTPRTPLDYQLKAMRDSAAAQDATADSWEAQSLVGPPDAYAQAHAGALARSHREAAAKLRRVADGLARYFRKEAA